AHDATCCWRYVGQDGILRPIGNRPGRPPRERPRRRVANPPQDAITPHIRPKGASSRMSRNDAQDFAQRLYARIPAHYRAYDVERGLPLLALVTVVAEQAANLRQDLDSLWDDFFIETCADWAVPYIGALVGTNLLQ